VKLHDLLREGSLRMDFQPMYFCDGGETRLFALEALARGPQGSHFEQPSVLFDYIRFKHAEVEADRACMEAALRSAPPLPEEVLLSINVHACTLERDRAFPSWLLARVDHYGFASNRLVLEIVEQGRYWSRDKLVRSLVELRAAGVRMALDDLGAGSCNFGTILDTRPDYLKIDAYIVQGCAGDPFRRRMLESISRLARDFGALAVAEGIETQDDLTAIGEIGIEVVQGFLLGKPMPPSELGFLTAVVPEMSLPC
jgi:EAL domain-containing protein (putative c-di-GMP-specific phosphodiesterase class I)